MPAAVLLDAEQAGPIRFKSFVPRRNVVKLEQLFNLIGPDMKAVDVVIRARLHSDVVLVRQVAEYIVNAGGKQNWRWCCLLLAPWAIGARITMSLPLSSR